MLGRLLGVGSGGALCVCDLRLTAAALAQVPPQLCEHCTAAAHSSTLRWAVPCQRPSVTASHGRSSGRPWQPLDWSLAAYLQENRSDQDFTSTTPYRADWCRLMRDAAKVQEALHSGSNGSSTSTWILSNARELLCAQVCSWWLRQQAEGSGADSLVQIESTECEAPGRFGGRGSLHEDTLRCTYLSRGNSDA